MTSTTPLTAAEQHALETTTRGGIKATSLAGAIFNHKDDKKGQQNTHRQYFEHEFNYQFNFPDTSNTRYGSHCEAAAELLLHLPTYLKFLEYVRDSKDKRTFNHMEANLYKALRDPATLSELAVLALYAQSVTYAYLERVRGPGTENVNILDLGPFHFEVRNHVAKIAADPSILLQAAGEEGGHRVGRLDGKMWKHPEVLSTVFAMQDSLPCLRELIGEFFHGALTTWERFTSEFAPGGLIDTSTVEERNLAWMPSTNDANEGALGSFRVYIRHKPSTTMHFYTAQAMFHRNDTQAFMSKYLQSNEDQKYLMRTARDWDKSGKLTFKL